MTEPHTNGGPDAALNGLGTVTDYGPPPVINAASWQGLPVPTRQWVLHNRVPSRSVTLLSGEGAIGKSTLMLQQSCAHTIERAFFGVVPKLGPALFVSAEDEAGELHFRTAAIAAHLGIEMSALYGLHLVSLVGRDALLGAPNHAGIIRPTPLFTTLCEIVRDVKPVLIALESAADLFGGNENDRSQVRQFIGMLRGLAILADAGVLLAAHPSVHGVATNSGLSGSTAWANSVRARMVLKAEDAPDGGQANPDVRVLEVRKSNYGPAGEVIRMRWENGLFVPIGTPSSLDRLAADQAAEHAFLALLKRYGGQNQRVGPYKGPSYAPARFTDHPDGKPFGSKRLAAAMQRLLDAGTLRIVTEGSEKRRRSYVEFP
jgi:RecA-family ATPase